MSGQNGGRFTSKARQFPEASDLLAARVALIAEVIGAMPEAHQAFPLDFERGDASRLPDDLRNAAPIWIRKFLQDLRLSPMSLEIS